MALSMLELSALFAISLVGLSSAHPRPSGPKSISLPGPQWLGLRGLSRAVIFGDSYTTVGFNTSGTQPSAQNPLGNPPYPGYTSSNGPNWVDFLTFQYNQSLLQTLDLAYGGATVDGALVEPYLPTVLSVKQQVQDEFLPIYGQQSNVKFPWQSKSTLFASIFSEYAGLVEQLYSAGARNFLFVNVPPVDRSPLTVDAGTASQAIEKEEISEWNKNVTRLATHLKAEHQDSSIFIYDANTLFSQVLDNPSSYPETSAYKNTTNYCVAYENGTPNSYSFNSTCGIPVDEYFWLNSLHPTFRMQQLLAKQIAQQLSSHASW